ncbi:tripartite tricarboxylate transporter permease [Gymnodinialimonas sp. 57CJ19]|uniref:tripartite tricarboxylate transporter permease n=1 Tax=Gymnodinialimonas sp. 57CJ19 TaxID=3138498 RepID=UPI003134610D
MDLFTDAALTALGTLLQPLHLAFLCMGVMIGLVVGFLPGLGGLAGLSLILPFIFGMDPTLALAVMIGLIAPTTTSDTFPAILMGIPGTSASQATVLDGFPLAKRGEGARALAAAFTASLFGGLIGALALTVAVFAARPVILSFGFGEQLMLVVFSLSMVGVLTGDSVLKGLAACGAGLALGAIGAAPATGEYRMTFDTAYLTDGLSIVIVGLGLFAVPEIVDLLRQKGAISSSEMSSKGRLQGVMDTIRNKWLVLRCALIGSLVGALPGLGGAVVDWITYGHVVQSSKDRSQFGKGDIRGVIAPEAANNAKEGGALMPTLLFGIPGSGTMAVLLGGFLLVGIQPGMRMVTDNLDLTFTMIWSLALANILGALVCFALAGPVSRLTTIRYSLIGPIMIVIIFFAAFQVTRSWSDLVALFLLGVIGIYMKRFGWPRPALLIGFVLAAGLETSVYQAIQIYGFRFFERPLVLVITALTVLSVGLAIFSRRSQKPPEAAEAGPLAARWPQLAFTLGVGVFLAVVIADALTHQPLGRVFPLSIGIISAVLVGALLVTQVFTKRPTPALVDHGSGEPGGTRDVHIIGWILGLLAGIALVGFPIAAALFVLIFATVRVDWHPIRNLSMAGGVLLGLFILAQALTLIYPGGLLQEYVTMPRWLGQ